MGDSGNKRNRTIIDVILIILLITLAYVLYNLIGGNWSGITQMGSGSPADPFGAVAESVSAFGRGLQNAFGNIVP